MALYKIGITEAGDAGVDLSWEEKLDDVDAAVLITKCVSPDFFDAALEHKDRLIVHATITGYGHSILEPNVPTPYDEFAAIMTSICLDFLRIQNQMGLAINERAVCVMQGKLNC